MAHLGQELCRRAVPARRPKSLDRHLQEAGVPVRALLSGSGQVITRELNKGLTIIVFDLGYETFCLRNILAYTVTRVQGVVRDVKL